MQNFNADNLNNAILFQLLDEIQLRFRDMFLDSLKAGDVFRDFSSFGADFPKVRIFYYIVIFLTDTPLNLLSVGQ